MERALIAPEANSRLSTPTEYLLNDYNQVAQDASVFSLGLPTRKRLFEPVHLSAALLSLVCLLMGILTVIPDLKIAWLLRFNGQIIVLGFLFGIMNLCMQTIVPHSLVLLEARFGWSRLQNYEALLTSRVLSPDTSFIWRLALVLLMALPLGLSVAYKRFLGGVSSRLISVIHAGLYGLDFARVGIWAPPRDAIYLLTTSISPFLAVALYDPQPLPLPTKYPVAYGYNTLLLNSDSAALLDMPTTSYISDLQDLMLATDTWNLSASVNAYVATRDTSSDFRTNDTTWISALETNLNQSMGGMSAMYLYDGEGARLGFLPTGANNECYFGIYFNSSDWGGLTFYDSPGESDYAQFRKGAQKYNLRRAQCHGTWQINRTTTLLLDGSCDLDVMVNSSILQAPNMVPFTYDVLPALQHVFGSFNVTNYTVNNVWQYPIEAVSVVTLYWARALYMIIGQGPEFSDYAGPYAPGDERIISSRVVLDSAPLLYAVMAMQPIITLLALVVTAALYHVPLGRGFGLVSILSGIDPGGLQLTNGAGLSGKLRTSMTLEVTVAKPWSASYAGMATPGEERIRYRLLSKRCRAETGTRLQRQQIYG